MKHSPIAASALSLLCIVAFAACSTASEPGSAPLGGDAGGSAGDGTPTTTLPAGDLGEACAAGCAGTKLCTVTDPACATGHCLFDARSGASEAYCTADCSSAACPTGFACEDVPFKLARACVRANRAPNPLGPRVRGTVRVKGTRWPLSQSPAPYETVETLDTAPTNTLANTPCGSVWIAEEPRLEPVLHFLTKLCKPEVPVLVTVELPLRTGSFPDGSSLPSPVAYVAVESGNGTILPYGSHNSKVPGVTIAVEHASDVDTKSTPWKIGRLVAKISGTLPQGNGCDDTSCPDGSKTIAIEADLELSNVMIDEDGK